MDGKVDRRLRRLHYYGTGDIGGSPRRSLPSNCWRPSSPRARAQERFAAPVSVGDGPVHVVPPPPTRCSSISSPTRQPRTAALQGRLELINHSAGSLTSQAYQKRWNRKNELLADAAEKASVAAEWLGGRPYPQRAPEQRLDAGHGRPLPRHRRRHRHAPILRVCLERRRDRHEPVRRRAWPDATEAVASGLDTQTKGTAVVVYNPLNIAREDVVEAEVSLPRRRAQSGSRGRAGRQASAGAISGGKVLFLAKVPSVGYAVYDVEPAADARRPAPRSKSPSRRSRTPATASRIDPNGDIASIFDKSIDKELLSAPVRLAISRPTIPSQWPAWNMDWDQEQARRALTWRAGDDSHRRERPGARGSSRCRAKPKARSLSRPSASRPATPAIASKFGDVIDWNTREANLKAVFPLTASNPMATYNWDIGTIQRPTAEPNEVRSGVPPMDRSHRSQRRFRRDDPDRLQERLRQARRQHASASPCCARPAPDGGYHRPGHPGLGPSRIRLRHRRPCGRLAQGARPTGRHSA